MSPSNIYLNNKIVGAIVNFSDKYFNGSSDNKFAYAFLKATKGDRKILTNIDVVLVFVLNAK